MRALRTLLLCLGILAGTLILCAMFTGCATGPEPDPTPEKPRIACIAKGLSGRINPLTGGRTIPEAVRIIGVTSHEDGKRLMVVRGVFNRAACLADINGAACGWLPYDRDAISTGAICGREAEALREIDRHSAANP